MGGPGGDPPPDASAQLIAPADAAASDGGGGSLCAPAGSAAPTYTQLYATYFAPGTPGHCANAGCHGDPGHSVWLCGSTPASCYSGMVGVGLIDVANPTSSLIADPANSPLSWINPDGPMPAGARGSNPAGRDAIVAWVAACAPND